MTEEKGKWLIAENPSIEPIGFRHPDHEVGDRDHLHLGSFEAQIVDPMWLEVPWFAKNVDSERINVRWSDDAPENEFTVQNVLEGLVAKGFDRTAALTIYQICAFDGKDLPDHLDQYIELAPSGEGRKISATYIGQRWDLIEQHLPFLEAVLDLERQWRKRRPLIRRLNARIKEIKDMR